MEESEAQYKAQEDEYVPEDEFDAYLWRNRHAINASARKAREEYARGEYHTIDEVMARAMAEIDSRRQKRTDGVSRLVVSDQAESDILTISVYIAEESGKLRAVRVVERIRGTMDKLAFTPGIGRGRSYLEAGLRASPSAPWTIVYSLLPEGDGINVVRILHGRRNLPRNLREFMTTSTRAEAQEAIAAAVLG